MRRRRNIDKQFTEIKRAIAADPENTGLRQRLISAYQRAGMEDEFNYVFVKTLNEEVPGAVNPNPGSWVNLGNEQTTKQRFSNEIMRELNAKGPFITFLPKPSVVWEYSHLGKEFQPQGPGDIARAAFLVSFPVRHGTNPGAYALIINPLMLLHNVDTWGTAMALINEFFRVFGGDFLGLSGADNLSNSGTEGWSLLWRDYIAENWLSQLPSDVTQFQGTPEVVATWFTPIVGATKARLTPQGHYETMDGQVFESEYSLP